MRRLLALALLTLASGCGTIASFAIDETDRRAEPFGGVRMDARVIDAMGRDALWLCGLCVLDMPLSLVADVVLLPYTSLRTPDPEPEPTPE